jgi:hypothetical protein
MALADRKIRRKVVTVFHYEASFHDLQARAIELGALVDGAS